MDVCKFPHCQGKETCMQCGKAPQLSTPISFLVSILPSFFLSAVYVWGNDLPWFSIQAAKLSCSIYKISGYYKLCIQGLRLNTRNEYLDMHLEGFAFCHLLYITCEVLMRYCFLSSHFYCNHAQSCIGSGQEILSRTAAPTTMCVTLILLKFYQEKVFFKIGCSSELAWAGNKAEMHLEKRAVS